MSRWRPSPNQNASDRSAEFSHIPDYFWYKIGDMICISKKEQLYYCFPQGDICVAKARLAAEEQYKLQKTISHRSFGQ